MTRNHDTAKPPAEKLAELTDEPVEVFEYDGDIPELDDLETEDR